MPALTVRQMLQDVARPILVALTTDAGLSSSEQNVAASAVAVVDQVLGDLNASSVIASPGKRNADATNLQDQCVTPLVALDRAHESFAATRLYDALDAVADARALILRQVGSDLVTY